MNRFSTTAAVAASCIFAAIPAQAATSIFTDPVSFAAALGGAAVNVQSYENAPVNSTISSGQVFEGVTYAFNNNRTGRIGNIFNRIGDQSLEAVADNGNPNFFVPGNTISMTFGTALTAVGGYFNANTSLVDQFFLTAAGVTATGGGAMDSYDVSTLFFIGIVSDEAFSTATFGALNGTTGVYNFDDLTTVNAIGAVPEPATWAMMIIGFGFAGMALRRRQRVNVRFAV